MLLPFYHPRVNMISTKYMPNRYTIWSQLRMCLEVSIYLESMLQSLQIIIQWFINNSSIIYLVRCMATGPHSWCKVWLSKGRSDQKCPTSCVRRSLGWCVRRYWPWLLSGVVAPDMRTWIPEWSSNTIVWPQFDHSPAINKSKYEMIVNDRIFNFS